MATVNLEKVSKLPERATCGVRAGLGRCRRRADGLVGPSGSGKTTALRMVRDSRNHLGHASHGRQASTTCPRRTATWPWCSRTTPCTRT